MCSVPSARGPLETWPLINVAHLHALQGQRISFGGQLQNYQAAVQQLVNILGDEDSAANHLSQCIFTVGMGSNDYLNNYFMPTVYSTSQQYTPEQYADVLINQYAQQLRVRTYVGTITYIQVT